jgi:hypothetical protein
MGKSFYAGRRSAAKAENPWLRMQLPPEKRNPAN